MFATAASRARRVAPAGLAAGLAALLGLAAGRLPLVAAGALILGGAVGLLVLAEPAAGLALTLVVAPSRAWLNAVVPGVPLDPGQVMFALTLAAWLALGVARRRLTIPRPPAALTASLGAVLLIGAWSLWYAPSLPDGLAELAKWIEIAVMAALAYDAALRGRLAWMVGAVLAAGALQALVGIWQFGFSTTGPESFAILGDRLRAYGTFQQPNPFAGYLGLVWPVAAGLAAHRLEWLRQRKPPALEWFLFAGLAGLIVLSLLLSFSRGAWLAAALAALAMAAFYPRRPWAGLALGLLAALVFLAAAGLGLLPAALASRLQGLADFTAFYEVRGVPINDANYAVIQRLAFWQSAQAMAAAHPWLGVGLGNYAAAYPAYALLNWPLAIGHAHNIYLNTLAETGVLGLAAYLALWIAAAWITLAALRSNDGWRRGLALGLLGAWVHLAAHQVVDYLYVNNTHLLIGAYLGLSAALAANGRVAFAPKRLPVARGGRWKE